MRTLFVIIFVLALNISARAQQNGVANPAASVKVIDFALADTSKTAVKSDSCPHKKDANCQCKRNKSGCRMKDTFIDKDNDGINDNRCNRMGWGQKKKMGKCCKKK